jgi:molybdopterin molybdotransferase
MILFEQALDIVLKAAQKIDTEQLNLLDSLNRVLAEDVISDIEMPPFNKSAVDGYACRKEDLKDELEVIEIIPAGKMPEKNVGPKQCSKIMTGAPVPDGADTIIMVEDVEEIGENKIKYLKDKVKDNVCYRGEDIQFNDKLLSKGTLIKAKHIPVLATAGYATLQVYRQVKVAVISTGDELVEPNVKPQPSQIRNSNAYQLLAQIQELGAIPEYIGIALDTEESTRKMINKAFEGNDVILLTGGVSMGDFDHVPKILNELSVKLNFKSIAVQPGRPTVFGTRDHQYVFGLPGNPVSSFVQFELLVKPLIYHLSGYPYQPEVIRLKMGRDYKRKRATRLSWLPIKIDDVGEVIPLDYHGSAHINSLSDANGLIAVPIGTTELFKGDLVDVRQI